MAGERGFSDRFLPSTVAVKKLKPMWDTNSPMSRGYIAGLEPLQGIAIHLLQSG